MKDMLMIPKVWLIIVALMHLFMGVIGAYIQMGTIENLSIMIYLGIISIHLLYVAFMTEGQTQARFAVVLCAPMVVWFYNEARISRSSCSRNAKWSFATYTMAVTSIDRFYKLGYRVIKNHLILTISPAIVGLIVFQLDGRLGFE